MLQQLPSLTDVYTNFVLRAQNGKRGGPLISMDHDLSATASSRPAPVSSIFNESALFFAFAKLRVELVGVSGSVNGDSDIAKALAISTFAGETKRCY